MNQSQVLVEKQKLQEIHSEISKNIPILATKIQNALQCNAEVANEALTEVLRFFWANSIFRFIAKSINSC